jgi:hypothetical protein
MGGFQIIQNEAVDRWVEAGEPLWLTADRSELVPEGDPEAAHLFASKGKRISRADAIHYGLLEPDEQDEADEADEGAELVDAKIDEVLAEVGDDKEKARLALEAEQASGKPRKTLVAKLEELVAAEGEED